MRNTGNTATFVVNLYDDFGHIATDILKICTKCGKAKDILNFGENAGRKDGRQEVCKECKSLTEKLYRASNPEKSKQYCELNKEKIKIRLRQYAIKNADSLRQKRVEKFQLNKEKWNQYQRDRFKNDPIYKIKTTIRKAILKAIKGQDKSKSTQDIIGCTYIELRHHIESQFEAWMTWENKGLYNGDFDYGWDIDHIVPLASAKSPEDILYLNHYTNLRPLCSHVNRNIKRDKHE
jgi:hypothetical protein